MKTIRNSRRLFLLTALPSLAGAWLAGAAESAVPPVPAGTPPPTVPVAAAAVPAVPAPAPAAAAAIVVATPAAPATTPPAPAAPVAGRPGKVTANALRVRARPGTNYEPVAMLKRDDPVTVVGEAEDWLEIAVPAAAEAWVSSHFLDLPSGKVKADRLRVHAGPSGVYSTYAFIDRGFVVKPLGEPDADGWLKIEAPATATAWVNRKYVEFQGEVPKSANPAANVPAAVPNKPLVVSGPVKVDEQAAAQDPDSNPALSPEETQPLAPPPATAAPAAAVPVKPATVPPAAAAAPAKPAAAPVAEAPAKPATPAVPAKPALPGTPAVPPPPLVAPIPAPAAPPPAAGRAANLTTIKEGVVTSLGMQASAVATHLLSLRQGGTLYPVCYLNSKRIELVEWEGRSVRVYGREIQYPGWKRVVLDVTGVQALPEK